MKILPDGYTQLEYIQSSGTQYVDTGVIPNQNTRVYAEAVLAIASSTQGLFGSRRSSSSSAFQFVTQGGFYRTDYNGTITNITSQDYGSTKFYVDKNKNVTNLNGEFSHTDGTSSFTCPGNLYVFATNNNGAVYANAIAKLYVMQVYDNGTLVRNFVPCKNASGEVGLYDLVNGVFYGNAGTGTFIAGPEFGYQKVEYIESSGTQYIDTGFKPNQDTRVICEGQFLDISSTVNMFGTRVSTSSGRFEILVSGNYIFSSYNTAAGSSIPSTTDVLLIDKNKNVTSNNGEVFDTSAYAAFQTNYNLLLFAGNRAGTVGGKAACRIYFFQIYDNGVSVRDYIPVVDSNGVAGLWDKVEQVFYGNAGTGAFIAGAIIPEEPELPIPLPIVSISAPYADFANVMLSWPVAEYAEGYKVMRGEEVIATIPHTFFYDSGLSMQTEYKYSVTAYNATGESEPVYIDVQTTDFKLITDRTLEDVQAVIAVLNSGALPNNWFAGMKGAYNATDLNRVQSAVLFVIERLKIAGWYLSVNVEQWTMVDFPTVSEMRQYLDNIRLLRSALPVGVPDVPADTDKLTYSEANTIEAILEMLDAAVTNIMQNVYFSNEIYSGEV